MTVKALALTLKESDWRLINWREGSGNPLKSRFARLRARPAHEDFRRNEPRPEEWLVIEWPEDEDEPTKYWFSTLDAGLSFAAPSQPLDVHLLCDHKRVVDLDAEVPHRAFNLRMSE